MENNGISPERVSLQLDVPANILQAYYRGQIVAVQAVADDGRSIRLPLRAMRRYFTHSGLHGHFQLEFDGSGKLIQVGAA